MTAQLPLDFSRDICSAHHLGNPQSVAANPSRTSKEHDCQRILAHLRDTPSNCDEAEVALGMSHQSCSARFTDLKAAGLIEQCGTRPTRSGRMAAVYRAALKN